MSGPLDSSAGRELLALMETFRSSLFRLETLQSYGGSGEDDGLRRFREGRPPPVDGDDDRAYLDAVRAARSRDARWRRVHVVREPLTEYLRFELTWQYGPNVAAGEEIGIVAVGPRAPWPTPWADRDFWLADDRRLFHLDYDHTGLWLGVEEIDDDRDIARARRVKAVALDACEPWHRYVARHPSLAARLTTDIASD